MQCHLNIRDRDNYFFWEGRYWVTFNLIVRESHTFDVILLSSGWRVEVDDLGYNAIAAETRR